MDFYNKNILLVQHEGGLGGAERQCLGLGEFLSKNYNCNVYLLLTHSAKTTKEFDDYLAKSGIKKVFHFGRPYLVLKKELSVKNIKRFVWSAKSFLKMRKELKPYKFDIIIPFLNFPSKVAYYLYKLLPTVKFTFWHQLGLDSQSGDVFETIAANNMPCVIANASNGLELFKVDYKLAENRAHILPQYLTMQYKAYDSVSIKEKLNIKDDELIIGMIAHYRPEKFQDLLLETFKNFILEFPNSKLVFVGNKNNSEQTLNKYDSLFDKIKEYRLEENVLLLSGIEVEKVLSVLDIGVLVSRIEGVPNAVMEYMLYGLPVVATNHPGCQGLLKETPFLIENNKKQLQRALSRLALSKEERVKEGNKNKELIVSYTKSGYVEKLTEIMNQYV
ncbi:glycosyltransferase [Algibacter sp. L4_22]|uniref:glycosyltransferase n=1 Tax=Algibacter sp. L4_22 TaxID=2942477 RepID=UPI00201B65F0|nr:glycosyltransferase [Algibacter sp. L4_22]MCL5128753.1 glycosyltransferase [Algibacter sp. L4_22]